MLEHVTPNRQPSPFKNMEDSSKDNHNLKEQIGHLMRRLKEFEQNYEILLENRNLLKDDRQRLLEKLVETESFLKFSEERRQKANEKFVKFIMESYDSRYVN